MPGGSRGIFPGLDSPSTENKQDNKEDEHNRHESDPEIRALPHRYLSGFFAFRCRGVSSSVCRYAAPAIAYANARRRSLFPFGKTSARVVGRQPVLVAEILAAVLAVEREGDFFPAEIAAWHFFISLSPGIR